jgi:hypothetical protein
LLTELSIRYYKGESRGKLDESEKIVYDTIMKMKGDKTENRRGPGKPPEEPGKVQSRIVHVRMTEELYGALKRRAGGAKHIPSCIRDLIRDRLES